MSEPTPETTSNISRLEPSSTRAIGTLRTPRMSIQVNSGEEMSVLEKIAQLQMKLPKTAAIEMRLLTVFQRRVNSVITAAEPKGKSKTNQGSNVLAVNIRISRNWFARE